VLRGVVRGALGMRAAGALLLRRHRAEALGRPGQLGLQAVHADPRGVQLDRELVGEAAHAGLGRGVGRRGQAHEREEGAAAGAGQDPARAAPAHLGQHGADRMEGPDEVERDHVRPPGRIDGVDLLVAPSAAGDAGEDVDPAVGLQGQGRHGLALGEVGDVRRAGARRSAGGRDGRRGVLEPLPAAPRQHHARALAREGLGHGAADVEAPAGDDRDLPLEALRHASRFFRRRAPSRATRA
jgi:hypothetical protein